MNGQDYNDQYGQNTGNSQNDQNQYQQYQQDPYGQNQQYQQNAYGQNQQYQQDPYGQNQQYQQNPYGQQNQGNYYQGYNTNQQYQSSYYQQPAQRKVNVLSVIGLILGILSILANCNLAFFNLIFAVPGLVCSIIGYKQGKSGLSIGGIVCSSIGIVIGIFWVVMLVVGIYFLSNMNSNDLREFMNIIQQYYQ